MSFATASPPPAEESSSQPSIVLICLHADPTSAPGIGDGGGTHRYLRELLEVLARSAIPHLLLVRKASADLPTEERVSPFGRLIRVDIGPPGKLDKRLLDQFHHVTVRRILESLAQYGMPELLHSVYWNSGRAAADLSRRLMIPFVHTVISNGWRRLNAGYSDQLPVRIDVERQIFHSAERVFCICSQERDDLIAHYGVPPERIIVVGRPVARQFLSPCRNGIGEPRCLPAVISSRESHAH